MRARTWALGSVLVVPLLLGTFAVGARRSSVASAGARSPRPHRAAAERVPTSPTTSPPDGLPSNRTVQPSVPRVQTHGLCARLRQPDGTGRFLSLADLSTATVTGDGLLARVGRSAATLLPVDWSPDDLVELETGEPSTPGRCESSTNKCLRREAASALRVLLAAMQSAGHAGYVHSAFRAYRSQCRVFARWAYEHGERFCEATEQSALAGHSQHQLGTTIDLFTDEWASNGPVFRPGFGCSDGGRWLATHGWEYGYVHPYTVFPEYRAGDGCSAHRSAGPDPRTGYRAESWHMRYIGAENARRFHDAWLASGPGTGTELALDQWLRPEARLAGDGDLPVCDGCSCGACTTLAEPDERRAAPCADRALRVRPDGQPVGSASSPRIDDVRATPMESRVRSYVIEARLTVAAGTVTQTPSLGLSGPAFDTQTTFASFAALPRGLARAYPDLPGAWRIAIEPEGDAPAAHRWPWRTGLADPEATADWNAANLYLPALTGTRVVRVAVHVAENVRALRVGMLRDGNVAEFVVVPLPIDR